MRWVLDATAIVLLVANVLLGLRYGVIGRLLAFAGVYSGVAAATFAGNGVARFFAGKGSPDDLYHAGWSYALIFLIVVAMFEVIGALYRDKITAVISLLFERSAGVVAGIGVAFLEFAMLCMVLLAVGQAANGATVQVPSDHAKAAAAVHDSWLGNATARAEDQVRTLFSGVLPSDLASHLAEATEP
jgi:uncharacterized membrane protein required for colicin V production